MIIVVDGQWNAWTNWTACSRTCGNGHQNRQRTCVYDDIAPHGADCQGSAAERQRCKESECPGNGTTHILKISGLFHMN